MNTPQKSGDVGMNENKIPTDREILTAWKARAFPRPPKGGCWPVAYCTDADMLEVIREARAAGRAEGREEQRERDAVTLEKRAEQLKTHKDFENEAAELELQAKIIRAQGEEEK